MAASFGGGLSTCNATIGGNRISSNSSGTSGGGLAFCDEALIQSNVICTNSSTVAGGGIFDCDAPIINNTVVGNSSNRGGGMSLCDGMIVNCIVWDNTASSDPQLDRCSDPSYCCIQGWTGGGENNIAANPLFIDADGPDGDPGTCEDNDYRLTSSLVFTSPCIDTGENSVLNPPSLDADGNLRISRGRDSSKYPVVDMGAYERGSLPFSVIEITDDSGGDVTLTWNSQVNDTYIVLSCKNLLSSSWIEEASVPSEGSSTTWIDPAPATSMKSYRVQMVFE